MRSQLLNTSSFVFKRIAGSWQRPSTPIAAHLHRNLSNASPTEKPYYVTTPIFYVNAGRTP